MQKTDLEFRRELRTKHEGRVIALSPYVRSSLKMKFGCVGCTTTWDATPNNVISKGSGCPPCSYAIRAKNYCIPLDEFHRRLAVHPFAKIESIDEFCGVMYPHKFRCLTCSHEWKTAPLSLFSLNPTGCPKCAVGGNYSMAAVRWLNDMSDVLNIDIRHARNGGEFCVGKRFRFDGFHERSGTVFEFYGDDIHGNPAVHRPRSYPNPFKKNLTARTLYSRTLHREEFITDMGYHLVHIWQYDFRNKERYKNWQQIAIPLVRRLVKSKYKEPKV